MNKILLISGPSGIGKSYILKKLISSSSQYEAILSTTTREMREGESDGIDYEFLTRNEYVNSKQKFFMDNYFFNNFYGIKKKVVDDILEKRKIPVGIIYTPVIHQFLKAYPDALTIFLYPQNIDLWKENLLKRDGSLDRYQYALDELSKWENDYSRYYNKVYYINSNNDDRTIIDRINHYFDIYRDREGSIKEEFH